MKSVVFLVSGGGGNLKFFYLALKYKLISGIKLHVIADRECGALKFAGSKDIDNNIILYKRSHPESLTRILVNLKPDIIVTNWHKIIDVHTVASFQGKLVNLHYSLLPAFSGLIGVKPIARAYEQGCKFIGPTCHLVDEGVDTGNIISQAVFSTERSFEDSVNLMFNKGCLVLLSGIQQVLGQRISTAQVSNFDPSYGPPLGFDESIFNEKFWKELAIL